MANHHELPVSASNAEPFDVITMNSRVIYVEEPGGERRSVTLVHPREAHALEGRISVLSPVGRALLRRAPRLHILVSERGPS
jgi:transcription elongation GreA/GreB family factor